MMALMIAVLMLIATGTAAQSGHEPTDETPADDLMQMYGPSHDIGQQTASIRLERGVKNRLKEFFGFGQTPAHDVGFKLEDAFAPAICDNNIVGEMDEAIKKMQRWKSCVESQMEASKMVKKA